MAEDSTGETIRSQLRLFSDIFDRTFWKQNKLLSNFCQAGWTLPLTSLRKPIYIFVGERNFNPTREPNNWRKNSFDAHRNTGVPVLTRVPLLRQVQFCVQWKVSRKDAKACSTTSFESRVLRMEAEMKNSPKRSVRCLKKVHKTHKKNTRKSSGTKRTVPWKFILVFGCLAFVAIVSVSS